VEIRCGSGSTRMATAIDTRPCWLRFGKRVASVKALIMGDRERAVTRRRKRRQLLPPFQIINHSKKFGESNILIFD